MKEVATPVLFGVTIIILVFLPLMTLEGMEGKLFAPLAYTIAIALAISLVLSLTLSPVLSSYLLKGGSEEDTWLVRILRRPYEALLRWAMTASQDYGHRCDRRLLRRAVSLSLCWVRRSSRRCRRVRSHPMPIACLTSRLRNRSRWKRKCSA